jgi:hypothetical protein
VYVDKGGGILGTFLQSNCVENAHHQLLGGKSVLSLATLF